MTYFKITSLGDGITIPENKFIGRTDFSTLIIQFIHDVSKATPTMITIQANAFKDCTNLDVVIFEINEQKNTGSNNNVIFNIDPTAFLGCKLSTISLGVNFNTVANAMFSALSEDRRSIITKFFGAIPRNSSFISITKIGDTISDRDNRPKGDTDHDKYRDLIEDIIPDNDNILPNSDNRPKGERGGADDFDIGYDDFDIDDRRDHDNKPKGDTDHDIKPKGDTDLDKYRDFNDFIDDIERKRFTFPDYTIDNRTLTYYKITPSGDSIKIPPNMFAGRTDFSRLIIKFSYDFSKATPTKIIIGENAFKDCTSLDVVIFEINEQKNTGSNNNVIFNIAENAFSGCELSAIFLGVNFNTVANAMFSALNEDRRPFITNFFGATPRGGIFITITDLDGKIIDRGGLGLPGF